MRLWVKRSVNRLLWIKTNKQKRHSKCYSSGEVQVNILQSYWNPVLMESSSRSASNSSDSKVELFLFSITAVSENLKWEGVTTNSDVAFLDTSVTGTIPRAAPSSCSSWKLMSFPQQDPINGVMFNCFCEPQWLFDKSVRLYICLSVRTGNNFSSCDMPCKIHFLSERSQYMGLLWALWQEVYLTWRISTTKIISCSDVERWGTINTIAHTTVMYQAFIVIALHQWTCLWSFLG